MVEAMVDLSTIKAADKFHKTFLLAPRNQRLVNRFNRELGWWICGKGSQDFASTLLGIAGNIAALHWCNDDTSISVYRMCAASGYNHIRKLPQWRELGHMIKFPRWIENYPQIQ